MHQDEFTMLHEEDPGGHSSLTHVLQELEDTIESIVQRATEIATGMKRNYEILSASGDEPFVAWIDSDFQATTGRMTEVKRAKGIRGDVVLTMVSSLDRRFSEGTPRTATKKTMWYELEPYGVVLNAPEEVDQFFDKPNPFDEANQIVAMGLETSMAFSDCLTKHVSKAFEKRGLARGYHRGPSMGTSMVMDMMSPEAIEKL